MKRKIKALIRLMLRISFYLTKPVVKLLLRTIIGKPLVLFRFDGGTCSQLKCYLCYKYLEDEGITVAASMEWFKHSIQDKDSTCARVYNLDKLFDLGEIEIVPRWIDLIYRNYFVYEPSKAEYRERLSVKVDDDFKVPNPPCYLAGEYDLLDNVAMMKKYVHFKSAEEIFEGEIPDVFFDIISNERTVGVHVRRGDMAINLPNAYWTVIPKDYFINVCNIEELKDFTFFFFSEEPEWIIDNIIPYVSVECNVVDSNTAYYGYRDLFLLSQCRYQVTSQGSFGKYAYLLNHYENKRGICYDPEEEYLWKWIGSNKEVN